MIDSKVKTREGYELITAYEFNEIPKLKLEFKEKQRNKEIYKYCTDYMTFDIEDSHSDDLTRAWLYQWACKLKTIYIYGRTPSDFIKLLETLRDMYDLSDQKKIFIYVHFLGHEMQFLKHYLYKYDNNIQILAVDAHSYIVVDILGFRILCSWKLSGLSLDLFSQNYSETYIKAVGEIDYTVKRYQDEELNDSQWYYMFSDVASQHDAINGYLKAHDYTYCYDAPMTATGFVRTDCRHASEKAPTNWRKHFKRSRLSLEQYNLLKQAFMGGLTICSYKYSGQTIRGNLGHKDFTSSYPARQMLDYFPRGAPTDYGDVTSKSEFNDLINTYCCVFLLHIYKVQIKEGVTAPCIPSSKCIRLINPLKVNGKIVYADELTIAINEIDYKWIHRQYTFNDGFEVTNMIIFQRGEFPKFLKRQIMKYFDRKCKLKKSDPRLYMASKANLNGIYGMTATSIIRNKYEYDNDLILKPDEIDDLKELNKFYNSRNSFLPYQFSLYTTSWARDALLTMIECVGYENFLYCDTDSVFYIKTPENEEKLQEYNNEIRSRALEKKAYIDDNILGLATDEPKIRAFRGLHSKCYAMEEQDKEGIYRLKVTIAGITAKATKYIKGDNFVMAYTMSKAEELEHIDNLQDGFIFKHNGGTRAIYVESDIHNEKIDGHITDLASGVIIDNVEKEISDTMFTVDKDYSLLHVNCTEIL